MPEIAGKRKELRYDTGTLVLGKSENGFRRFDVKIARAGVFPYVYQDGSVRMEAKLPEDLFSPVTIDSAKGAPVTEDHVPPSDSRGLVTPENYKKYVKGALGDTITVQDGHLCASETMFDADLLGKVENGEKVEVSIGFELDIDPTPGEYNGQRYDCAQRNIRINHVAHVDKGRAGDTVRVQLDTIPTDVHIAVMSTANKSRKGEIMPQPKTRADSAKKLGLLMRLVKLVGLDAEDLPADGEAAAGGQPGETAAATVEELKKQNEELAGQLKAALEKIAELSKEAQLPDGHSEEAAMDAKIAKRQSLLDQAKIIIPDVKTDGLKERDIKLKIIAAKLPFAEGVRQDSLSDARIDAQYEAAVQLARQSAADGGIGINADQVRSDAEEIEKRKLARRTRWDEAEAKRSAKK